mmetsp:Transcript_21087/g.3416  ORF Transcript_21087/g.3416 Transcript_21087/m.3416 type:complete len:107 (+) Transcript_21087:898-1218(+)
MSHIYFIKIRVTELIHPSKNLIIPPSSYILILQFTNNLQHIILTYSITPSHLLILSLQCSIILTQGPILLLQPPNSSFLQITLNIFHSITPLFSHKSIWTRIIYQI